MPKKPRSEDELPAGTSFLDYPESMSMYERDSLAAEAKLAELKKKSKPKQEKKAAIRVRVVPLKNVPIPESDEQ
jgi:hypothetical protein